MELVQVSQRKSSRDISRCGLSPFFLAVFKQFVEVGDGFFQSFAQEDVGSPIQFFFGQGNVGATPCWIVFRQGRMHEFGSGAGKLDNGLRQFENCEFAGVAQVYGTVEVVAIHHGQHACDEVVDVAKGAGLLSFAIDGNGVAFECLYDEIADYASIVDEHARTVGVEDTYDANVDVVLPVIVEEEGFCDTFSFIITAARADGIDVAPVAFHLGVDCRIAVDLRGGGLQDACADAFGQAEGVECAHYIGLDGFYGVVLIMYGGGWTGKVENTIGLYHDRVCDVMSNEFEVWVVQEVGDVLLASRKEIIQAEYFFTAVQQLFAKVRTNKSGTAGNKIHM